MAIQPRRAPRRRPYATLLVLTAATGLLGWCLYPLVEGGQPRLPFELGGRVLAAGKQDDGPRPVAEGRVRVLVSGRPIEAYAKVAREDLWNAARGTWAHVDLDEEMARENGVLVDVQDIVGRVMARPKAPGFAFTEKDFLPEGTRPGLAAGVPAGKRALRVDVDRVQGIIGLQPGDRFDIVAAWELGATRADEGPAFVGLYKHLATAQTTGRRAKPLEVRAVVQNGVVVTPLETRLVPTSSTTLTAGTTTRTLPVQEMVIAIDPEEVPTLMEAFASDARVTCLARSGLPDDPHDSETPSSTVPDPLAGLPRTGAAALPAGAGTGELRVIEAIHGSRRELVPVPGGESPH